MILSNGVNQSNRISCLEIMRTLNMKLGTLVHDAVAPLAPAALTSSVPSGCPVILPCTLLNHDLFLSP